MRNKILNALAGLPTKIDIEAKSWLESYAGSLDNFAHEYGRMDGFRVDYLYEIVEALIAKTGVTFSPRIASILDRRGDWHREQSDKPTLPDDWPHHIKAAMVCWRAAKAHYSGILPPQPCGSLTDKIRELEPLLPFAELVTT